MNSRAKRSLHDEIMNLPIKVNARPSPTLTAYKLGHRDARHAAAELAAEQEEIQSALVEALEDLLASNGGGNKSCGHDFTCVCTEYKAKAALSMAYGETQ